MNVVGVIAEYNPFHNGHAYQLRELKKRTGADYIVIAMSGNYVQRGEPALVDKYARTQMALENGADLVLELPVQWATASAEKFAQGGVELLAATGVVDFLGFGAEDDALSLMKELAQILVDEPESYRAALGEALRNGVNFPTARMQALSYYLTDKTLANDSDSSTSPDQFNLLPDLLSHPNNILALEYLKALLRGNYAMESVLIPRIGDGYHEEDAQSEYASATAIRRFLLSEYPSSTAIQRILLSEYPSSIAITKEGLSDFPSITGSETTKKNPKKNLTLDVKTYLGKYLPTSCADILSQYQSASRFLCEDDFSQILGYRLLSLRESGYDTYADISPELSSRIRNHVDEYQSFSQFCELLKTKELTYTRISRALLHLILDIQDDQTPKSHFSFLPHANTDSTMGIEPLDVSAISHIDSHIPYLRILGFRRSVEPLLHAMKQRATLPIITKMADAPRILDAKAIEILQKEIFVSDLYTQIAQNHRPSKNEDKGRRNHRSSKNEVNHGLILI